MEKINLVELLKDCPKGMELDCTIYDNVEFEGISDNKDWPIAISVEGYPEVLNPYGCISYRDYTKCVIYPKGKTTWEGFVPPCKFKDGDVLVSEQGNIVLFSHIDSENIVHYHCIIPTYGSFRIEENTSIGVGRYYECVLANEQQRQRMYDKIKCSGYKYNQQLNKLEKLIEPKFKVGDRVKRKEVNYTYIVTIVEIDGEYYTYVNQNGEPASISIKNQDKWELVPNKFDITTLKPFDKVLVRNHEKDEWQPNFFNKYYKEIKQFKLIGICIPSYCNVEHHVDYCIPYEGNEHLLGTTNDCDDFYKTWE